MENNDLLEIPPHLDRRPSDEINISGEAGVPPITGPLEIPEPDRLSQSQKEEATASAPDDSDQTLSQRDKVIAVGSAAELWHDADHIAYATVKFGGHTENYKVRSRRYKQWLLTEYGQEYRKSRPGGNSFPSAPSSQALNDGINTLEAIASEGEKHDPRVRVSEFEGKVYIDLGAPDWSAVEIDNHSWRIIDEPPVKFIRSLGLRSLPNPKRGGSLDDLKPFINFGSDDDFILLAAWLVGSLSPKGPYPILIVNGEQGSAKSTLCRVLRRLIDPNAAEVRSSPRDGRDLVIAARNGWVVALDNLSYISPPLSDDMCRVATGIGFATRTLCTDTDETIISICRPQVVNGIPDLASRPDLADRAIALTLPAIDEEERIPEQEFWKRFELEGAASILGVLFDGVSSALKRRDTISLSNLPRMADFAVWVEAASPALGWEPGGFLRAYSSNALKSVILTIEADPVASAVQTFMDTCDDWTGTATELLKELIYLVPEETVRQRMWPKSPGSLSNKLRRAAPALRHLGAIIDRDRAGATGERLIFIRNTSKPPSDASDASEDIAPWDEN